MSDTPVVSSKVFLLLSLAMIGGMGAVLTGCYSATADEQAERKAVSDIVQMVDSRRSIQPSESLVRLEPPN